MALTVRTDAVLEEALASLCEAEGISHRESFVAPYSSDASGPVT